MGARILVVDDESQMRRAIRLILAGHGYDVLEAADGRSALAAFDRRPPDLILLDLMLPDMPGLEVLGAIRARSAIPTLVLSARGDEGAKVAALDEGADDYVTKPFSANELLARVRVALRRVAGTPGAVFRCSAFELDVIARTVRREGVEVALTPLEYEVLKYLVANRDRVLTHAAVLRAVWGPPYVRETQYLRNVVLALRRKLEPDPSRPRFITTDPGVGYRFRTEAPPTAER